MGRRCLTDADRVGIVGRSSTTQPWREVQVSLTDPVVRCRRGTYARGVGLICACQGLRPTFDLLQHRVAADEVGSRLGQLALGGLEPTLGGLELTLGGLELTLGGLELTLRRVETTLKRRQLPSKPRVLVQDFGEPWHAPTQPARSA